MRTLFAAAAAATLVAVAAPAAAQAPAAPRPVQRIEIVGQAGVDRAPDRVIVTFEIVTNDDVATRATSANNAIYDALLAKMRGLGFAADAVRTTGYQLNYVARPAQPNPQYAQRYGYVVTRSVSVTSDSTDRAGAIMDGGVAAGVASIGSVDFTLRDPRAAYRAAQSAAVADAEAQARGLAAAAHVRLVRLLSITSGTTPVAPRPIGVTRMMVAAVAPPLPTDVQPSSLTVTASVTAAYEVAP